MQFKRIGYAYNFVSKININWVQKGSLVPIYNSSINGTIDFRGRVEPEGLRLVLHSLLRVFLAGAILFGTLSIQPVQAVCAKHEIFTRDQAS